MSTINVDTIQPQSGTTVDINGVQIVGDGPGGGLSLLIGEFTDSSLVTSNEDTIIGNGAGNSQTTSQFSTILGAGAAYAATSTDTTIVIGRNAADFLNTGQNNTIIGSRGNFFTPSYPLSAVGAFTGSNNIMIGANVKPSSFSGVNNEITLGNSSNTVLRCQVTSITSLSDERDKDEIKELSAGLDFINEIKPVSFVWKDRDEDGRQGIKDSGFIAQNLKEVQEKYNLSDELKLVYESNPEKLEASYGRLIPILVKAIQDLSEEVKQLKSK